MEIQSDAIAQCQIADVTFYVRIRANPIDKNLLKVLMEQAARDVIAGKTPHLSRDLAQLFVCGWSGVTLGGSPVAYSWALLDVALTPEMVQQLAQFVAENVDVLKTA
jgi:hypothetical protein